MIPVLIQNLMSGGAAVSPISATVTASFPPLYLAVMRPLWVTETPTDTIVVTPNTTPVGSFQ